MRHSSGRAFAALAACGLLMAGCGNPPEEASFACPQVGLLDNQSRAPVTNPGNDAPLATAQLAEYEGYCRYDGEQAVVSIDVTLDLTGKKAGGRREATVPYYVAVQNFDGEIVAKRQLTQTVTVPRAGQRRQATAALEPRFQLGETAPAAYTILVGLVDGQPSRETSQAKP